MTMPGFTAASSLQELNKPNSTYKHEYRPRLELESGVFPQAIVNCNFFCGQLRFQCMNYPSWMRDPFPRVMRCTNNYYDCLWHCEAGDLQGAIDSFSVVRFRVEV